jgi:hypothetical protein
MVSMSLLHGPSQTFLRDIDFNELRTSGYNVEAQPKGLELTRHVSD